ARDCDGRRGRDRFRRHLREDEQNDRREDDRRRHTVGLSDPRRRERGRERRRRGDEQVLTDQDRCEQSRRVRLEGPQDGASPVALLSKPLEIDPRQGDERRLGAGEERRKAERERKKNEEEEVPGFHVVLSIPLPRRAAAQRTASARPLSLAPIAPGRCGSTEASDVTAAETAAFLWGPGPPARLKGGGPKRP